VWRNGAALYQAIMVPISAARHLAQRKATLQNRRARLFVEIRQAEAELAEIETAERALSAPRNGKAVKLPAILQGLPITQKDRVLAAVRSRPKNGITRQWIVQKLADQNQPLGANSVSTYLTTLRNDGLVRYENGLWFPS
jgi:hypothetical protein